MPIPNSLRSFVVAQVTRGGRSVVPGRNFSSTPSSNESNKRVEYVSRFLFSALEGLAIGWVIGRFILADYKEGLKKEVLVDLMRELELKRERESEGRA